MLLMVYWIIPKPLTILKKIQLIKKLKRMLAKIMIKMYKVKKLQLTYLNQQLRMIKNLWKKRKQKKSLNKNFQGLLHYLQGNRFFWKMTNGKQSWKRLRRSLRQSREKKTYLDKMLKAMNKMKRVRWKIEEIWLSQIIYFLSYQRIFQNLKR
jgi:hypothetical protein